MTAKKPLELTARPCMIENVNLRRERHGDEDVPAVDVKLSNIILNKAELLRLTGDPDAFNLMFQQAKAGAVVEPTMQWCDGWRYLDAKYIECSSTLRFGMQKTEYELDDHKIKGAAVKALTGGSAELMLTLQVALEDDTRICAQLAEYQGKEGHVAITFGKVDAGERRQGKLALNDDDGDGKPVNKFGDGEQPATH